MISYADVRDVHLEISSLCNASCPWCPRTFWGYPYNDGYPEVNLTLEQCKKIFTEDFLQQLTSIRINGNFGDIVMNPEAADIVEYFYSVNPGLRIQISTNGAARDKNFWKRLAQTSAEIQFCLDGLADTHHLYRQNTVWATVIKNAKTVIEHNGNAVWKMIKFDHNAHQQSACRELSQDLGFKKFLLVDDGRNTAPVFDKQGKLTHVLGKYTGNTDFKILFHKKKTDLVLLEDIVNDKTPKQSVTCKSIENKSIYIAATGAVSPCCWTGFYPETFGHGQYYQAANSQIKELIDKNNALVHSLEECMAWFTNVESKWQCHTYETGRLVICDDNCGK